MINIICITFVCLILSPNLLNAQGVAPLTLMECYKLALQRSEVLASKQSLIKEAEGQFLQSLSTALPHVSFKYDIDYQHNRKRQELGRFNLSQPLFTGFKEIAAVYGSKSLKLQRRQEEIRAKQLLFVDVADAYYLFAYYLNDKNAAEDLLKVLLDEENEIIRRVSLGRARLSERLAMRARILNQEADLVQVKTDMEVAKHLLEFIIGTTVGQLQDANKIPQGTTRDLVSYEALLNKRSDVVAAQFALDVAKKKLSVARAGFWPNISLDGNYYTHQTSSTSQDWDALIKVDVPLFQGGSVAGDVKVAQAQFEQAQLVLSEIKRRALLETRQAYTKWQGAIKRYEAFDKAYQAYKESYQYQQQDYANRLISILDFLQASNDLQSAQRAQLLAKVEAARAWWQLKVKTGDFDDVDF